MSEVLRGPVPIHKAELLTCSNEGCKSEIVGLDILLAGNPPRCGNCKPRLTDKPT